MDNSSQANQESPSSELLWAAITTTGLALLLVAGTWVVTTGRPDAFIPLSDTGAVALALSVAVLIGLVTYLAGRSRPGWPDSDMARAGELTRVQVEREWGKPIKLAQDMTSAMEEVVKRTGASDTLQSPKQRVTNRLSLNTIRTTKAATSLIQGGFSESAIREWRTLFEIRVNAAYIVQKKQQVAQRFIEWGRMNHLSRTEPQSEELKGLKAKWGRQRLKPDNPDGWTGNPARDLVNRAKDVGLGFGPDSGLNTQMDMYKLANAFVHADWTASNATMGGLRPERTDGAAEGVGEILYLVMETAAATVMLSASDELKQRLNDDLWELRLMIRGAPERLRGQFIRLPLTEPMGILPDGRILVSAVKRREEWPEEEEKRSMDEMQELVSRITVVEDST